MRHFVLPRFWRHYRQLPQDVQKLADKNVALLKVDPSHPSLHLKRVGKTKQLWSVLVGEETCGDELAQDSRGRLCHMPAARNARRLGALASLG
jgi:hypothetical protein